jgi:hypothetical protein
VVMRSDALLNNLKIAWYSKLPAKLIIRQ